MLVARRHGVGYANGRWGLPGGHLEAGETFAQATAREVWEEIGVRVSPDGLTPIGMCRYVGPEDSGLDVFFTARTFTGEPRPVAECDDVMWAPQARLPQPVVPWLPDTLRRHLEDKVWFQDMT